MNCFKINSALKDPERFDYAVKETNQPTNQPTNILVCTSLPSVYHVTKVVKTMEGNHQGW